MNFAAILIILTLVNCGGGESTNNSNPILVLSPSGESVKAPGDTISIELKPNGLESFKLVNLTDNNSYPVIESNDLLYFQAIQLVDGENELVLTAKRGEQEFTKVIKVTRGETRLPRLSALTRTGYGETEATFQVIYEPAQLTSYAYDFDNDGIFDLVTAANKAKHVYATEGFHYAKVTVRTIDNLLIESKLSSPVVIKPVAVEEEIESLAGNKIIDFQKISANEVLILTEDMRILRTDMKTDEILEETQITGVSSVSGFCVDEGGNFYVVDGIDNSVLKLKSGNMQPDTLISSTGKFGEFGDGNGQFSSPTDCMVNSITNNQKIYIVDSGNNRVQVFNRAGVYLFQFDGSDTNEGKFNNPNGIVATLKQPIISDSGNNLIRVFDEKGRQKRAFGSDVLKEPKKITSSNNQLIIADQGNSRIALMTSIGIMLSTIQTTEAPSLAISMISDKDYLYFATADQDSKKVTAESDPSEFTPVKVVTDFVKTILEDNKVLMSSMSVSQRVVDRIYHDPDKLNVLIEHLQMSPQYQLQAKDGLFASVSISFENSPNVLNILLIKYDSQWLIKNF